MPPPLTFAQLFRGRVLLLALVFTLLNVGKPLTIDDPVYFQLGQQIASDPLDPYGCSIFWYEDREPANNVLAPAVFLYYLAGVFCLVGENVVLVKLALFPWAWLLVTSLDRLFGRFAPTQRLPFLIATVLSPQLVPGFNLMLDIPALALSLSAVELFLTAQDRGAFVVALAAGGVMGLAMQTKYTAFVVPGVILGAMVLRGCWRAGIVALTLGIGLFVGWEAYLAWKYGDSHFLLSAGGQGGIWGLLDRATGMVPFFLTYAGGLGCVAVLAGIALLRGPRWFVVLLGFMILAVHLMLLLFDSRLTNDTRLSPMLFGSLPPMREVIQPAEPAFLALGVGLLVVLLLSTIRLWREAETSESRGVVLFLVGWLVLEVGASLVLSPFPAARRIFGFLTVGALILARLAETSPVGSLHRRVVIAFVALQVSLALVYGGLDVHGAWVHRTGAQRAAQWIATQDSPQQKVWFVGHWGFQHYAQSEGMHPLLSDASWTPDRIEVGEWLVVPDPRLEQQRITLSDDEVELHTTICLDGEIPVRTVPCFHGGRIPVEHYEGPALEVKIFRAKRSFVARRGTILPFENGY